MTSPAPHSPTTPIPASPISHETLAAAAERRSAQRPPTELTAAQLAAEHERRQTFRRLVDPGIMRPNPKDQAMKSLKTLLTICENLLSDPENPKFQQFKPTNSIIKRNLVDPKGTLEYAIELGFRPEVVNFQPFYTFHPTPRRLHDLEIATAILKEHMELETEKQERQNRNKVDEKAVARAAAEKVKLAYMDDRKSKMLRDDMERQAREARLIAAANHSVLHETAPEPVPDATPMPGSGHTLGIHSDGPPAYNEHGEDNEVVDHSD